MRLNSVCMGLLSVCLAQAIVAKPAEQCSRPNILASEKISDWLEIVPPEVSKNWRSQDTIRFLDYQFDNFMLSKMISRDVLTDTVRKENYQNLLRREMAEGWINLRYNRLLGLTPSELRLELQQGRLVDSVEFERAFSSKHLLWAKNRFAKTDVSKMDSASLFILDQQISDYRKNAPQHALDSLGAYYKIQMAELPYPSAEEFYRQHPDYFQTPQAWSLKMIEMKDSTKLASILAKVSDLSKFVQASVKFNENLWTKNQKGNLGWYKQGYSLPYDLGDLPLLVSDLDNIKTPGILPGIYKISSKNTFAAFFVDSLRQSQTKSFDRVKLAIPNVMKRTPIQFPEQTALLKVGDSVVLTEGEYQSALKQFNPSQRMQISREYFADQYRRIFVFHRNAQDYHFESQKSGRAREEMLWNSFASQIARDSLNKVFWITASKIDSIQKLKPFLSSKQQAALYLLVPKRVLITEAGRYMDSLGQNSLKPTSVQLDSAFLRVSSVEIANVKSREIHRYKLNYCLELPHRFTFNPVFSNLKTVLIYMDSIYPQNEKLARANFLSKYYSNFIEDRNVDSVEYQLAKMYSDLERYNEALLYLNRIQYASPKSSLHDKALFMKGYILMEHLKKEDQAIKTYQALIKLHPKSDLVDDADFLVRDLKSGRKLSEELIKKIEGK